MTDRKTALAGQLASLAPQQQEKAPAAPMPAEQDKPEKWPARISMTASREMKHALDAARLDDGIEVTARLRAMIDLWQHDPKIRTQVDKLAKDLR